MRQIVLLLQGRLIVHVSMVTDKQSTNRREAKQIGHTIYTESKIARTQISSTIPRKNRDVILVKTLMHI